MRCHPFQAVRSIRIAGALLVVALAALAVPAIAGAADTIYWDNAAANAISFANLDGSGGGDLGTGAATVNSPGGTAIDAAAGKVYWASWFGATISWANLDGSGGGDLSTTGATVNGPDAVAIDPATGKIYWTNYNANNVSFANLDGSGGGGDLDTTGATVNIPLGVAIDAATGKVYWANKAGGVAISYANLDDSGAGGGLSTTGATDSYPAGLAIDPAAGRLYWTNANGDTVSYANLDGSGGGDLSTTGATVNAPSFPALLLAPAAAGAPSITAGSLTVGPSLDCSQGSWAGDLLEAFLYRVPQSFAYRWSLNGTTISGATSASYTPTAIGSYTCRVTATNHAGSTAQTSAAVTVATTEPSATTGAASSLSAGGATLNGTVNPQDLATVYHFEYGTSTAYGARVPATDLTVGSDTGEHAVSQSVSGLSPGTTYHFRVVATNADGTTYGTDQTFATHPVALSMLSVSPPKLSIAGRMVGGRCVKPTSNNNAAKHCRLAIKLKVSYTLNAAATVTLTLKREAPGRKVGGRCVAPTNQNKLKPKCTRLLSIRGKLVKTGQAGSNSFVWNGTIGGKKLGPGAYQLTATPSGGQPQRTTFKILG